MTFQGIFMYYVYTRIGAHFDDIFISYSV